MRLQSPSSQESTTLACPKCGFEQEEGAECRRCGIIFAKFKPQTTPAESPKASRFEPDPQPAAPGVWSRLFRVLPWISLALTTGVVLTILRSSPPLPIQTDPQAADRIAEKIGQLEMAVLTGRPHSLSLNEAELNQWMRDNLAIASAHQAQQAGIPVPTGHEASVQEVQSALKDVRMNLMGSQVRAYALFALYGKEISLQLDGTIETRDGFIRFKPTAGKLGSLSLPSGTLDRVTQQLLESPKNREMFRLPPHITSIGIVDSSLVIATR